MNKLILLLCAVLLVSCAPANNSTSTPIAQNEAVNVTAPTPTTPPNFENGVNPLANHDTYISFADVSTSFPEGTLVMEGASVPEVLVCPDNISTKICETNEILIYLIDAESLTSPGDEDIVLLRSTDGGKNWAEKQTITLEGKLNKGPAVDPSVVMLSDGTIRLYYFGPNGPLDPFSKSANSVYSATSSDGVNFTVDEGIRLTAESLTDPDVTKWNERWYMAYSTGLTSGLAVSEDGLNFEDLGEVSENAGGVPGLFADFEKLRIYGCGREGIASAYSSDGKSFTKDVTKVVDVPGAVCDPSISYSSSLGYVFVYKKVSE